MACSFWEFVVAHNIIGDSLSHNFNQYFLSSLRRKFLLPTFELLANTVNDKREDDLDLPNTTERPRYLE
jgi:hypothetical protein